MDIPITFNDFKTKELFLALQKKYAGWDQRNPPTEDNLETIQKEGFSILFRTVNLISDEDDYLELFFIKDFLKPKIRTLAKRYINNFKTHIEKELMTDKVRVKIFAEIQLKKFFELQDSIAKAEYLMKIIKAPLVSQINVVIDYLKRVHIFPNYLLNDKFKFNFRKIDVIVLFTLLREKKLINSPFDKGFGYLIEKSCLYKNGEWYTPIENAGKVVNDVKNLNRSVEKSIARLKKLLQNDDFYELKP